MRFKTSIFVFFSIFTFLFLAHFFVVLAIQGEYLVEEPNRWVAIFELVLVLGFAGLGVERALHLWEGQE